MAALTPFDVFPPASGQLPAHAGPWAVPATAAVVTAAAATADVGSPEDAGAETAVSGKRKSKLPAVEAAPEEKRLRTGDSAAASSGDQDARVDDAITKIAAAAKLGAKKAAAGALAKIADAAMDAVAKVANDAIKMVIDVPEDALTLTKCVDDAAEKIAAAAKHAVENAREDAVKDELFLLSCAHAAAVKRICAAGSHAAEIAADKAVKKIADISALQDVEDFDKMVRSVMGAGYDAFTDAMRAGDAADDVVMHAKINAALLLSGNAENPNAQQLAQWAVRYSRLKRN